MHRKRIALFFILLYISSLLLGGCGKQRINEPEESVSKEYIDQTDSEDFAGKQVQPSDAKILQDIEAPTEVSNQNTENAKSKETEVLPTFQDICVKHNENGGIDLCIFVSDFHKEGFSYGDSVDIVFSNGYELLDVPYYKNARSLKMEELLIGSFDDSYLNVKVTIGADLWNEAGISESDTANIFLHKQGKYAGEMLVNSLSCANDRGSFHSDEAFANFRSVQAGSIKENTLYRSSSPCNDSLGRASYVNSLISDAGISFVLDLADKEDTVKGYVEDSSFNNNYFKSLYEEGRVKAIRISSDHTSNEYSEMIAEGLAAMAEADGPYLITCLEGRDRTGFVCALLECLCGADYNEIKKDYMITYDNYYKINEETQKENYELIVEGLLNPMLQTIAGDENVDLTTSDLEKLAEEYLLNGGMTPDQIEKLKSKLIL